MAKYRVLLVEHRREYISVEVEAPSAQDAEELVEEAMFDGTIEEMSAEVSVAESEFEPIETVLVSD